MSGVFRNNDPPPPHRPASVYPSAFGAGRGHTRWVERGGGVNSSEDARQCYVLYIRTLCMLSIYCRTVPGIDIGGAQYPDKFSQTLMTRYKGSVL
jgi:hypothetical protein